MPGRWSATIGDPSPMGWLIFVAYCAAAILCFRVGMQANGRFWKERWGWLALAILMACLGINKQLDFQTLFTELLRDVSRAEGWYAERRIYQARFVQGLAFVVGLAGLAALAFVARVSDKWLRLAALGAVLGLGFIVLQVATFNHVDIKAFWPRAKVDYVDGRLRVSTATELQSALDQVKSGETILLSSGNYGRMVINAKRFVRDVTITSADLTKPALIESLILTDSMHLLFKSIEIGRPLDPGEAIFAEMMALTNCSNIVLDGLSIHGSIDGNSANDGRGLKIADSRLVTVKNSEFQQASRALLLSNSNDITIMHNRFRDLRIAGIVASTSQRVDINGNTFRNFSPIDQDHPDAIQFFSVKGAAKATDIIIRNNEIMQGDGKSTQGIFLRDQIGDLSYDRITIRNNLIYLESGYNGIAIDNGRGVKIIDNSVLSTNRDRYRLRILLSRAEGADVSGNVAEAILNDASTDVVLRNNLLLDAETDLSRRFKDIYQMSGAAVSGLTTPGYGYQPTIPAGPDPKFGPVPARIHTPAPTFSQKVAPAPRSGSFIREKPFLELFPISLIILAAWQSLPRGRLLRA